NVVAILPGKDKAGELVIFSAHYDHVGTRSTNFALPYTPERGKPEKGDTIYNGANDNASGISAMIMLARYFAATGSNSRTIVFIAFAGEEEGLYGSSKLALRVDHPTVAAMINLEMLGIPFNQRNKNPF